MELELSETSVGSPRLIADEVFNQLLERILTGELHGGTPLRIRDIAADVGTSVMPVREAIRRLQEIGLAAAVPHKGAVVRTLTEAELIQAYGIRMGLESQAAIAGTAVITQDDLHLMEQAYERMLRAVRDGDIARALDEDETIHRIVYQASGNTVLVELIETLWLRCRPFKFMGASSSAMAGDLQIWLTQRPFIDAVSNKKSHTAAGVISDSLEGARSRLKKSLRLDG